MLYKCDITPKCPYAKHNWYWRLRGRCNKKLCIDRYTKLKRVITAALDIATSEGSYEERQKLLTNYNKIRFRSEPIACDPFKILRGSQFFSL